MSQSWLLWWGEFDYVFFGGRYECIFEGVANNIHHGSHKSCMNLFKQYSAEHLNFYRVLVYKAMQMLLTNSRSGDFKDFGSGLPSKGPTSQRLKGPVL